MTNKPGKEAAEIQVLLVEDSEDDIELTREVLRDSKLVIHLSVVRDGAEALAYLRREGPYAESPRPDLVLLDLNLPRLGGLEVLKAVRADAELTDLAVVVLTTSQADRDIVGSYRLGANCFVNKPVGLEQFSQIVQSLDHLWFTVIKRPD